MIIIYTDQQKILVRELNGHIFKSSGTPYSRLRCNETFLYVKLKDLSHCHEFGYDRRRVNNSRHIVGKSKRCRRMSAVFNVHFNL